MKIDSFEVINLLAISIVKQQIITSVGIAITRSIPCWLPKLLKLNKLFQSQSRTNWKSEIRYTAKVDPASQLMALDLIWCVCDSLNVANDNVNDRPIERILAGE